MLASCVLFEQNQATRASENAVNTVTWSVMPGQAHWTPGSGQVNGTTWLNPGQHDTSICNRPSNFKYLSSLIHLKVLEVWRSAPNYISIYLFPTCGTYGLLQADSTSIGTKLRFLSLSCFKVDSDLSTSIPGFCTDRNLRGNTPTLVITCLSPKCALLVQTKYATRVSKCVKLKKEPEDGWSLRLGFWLQKLHYHCLLHQEPIPATLILGAVQHSTIIWIIKINQIINQWYQDA